MAEPKIYIIIVTYNGRQWYDKCFKSLRNSTSHIQTIVIDNASSDGSVEYIKGHYPEIILLPQQENLGFGRANNIGFRYALDHDADFVFLLNQDTWLEDNTAIQQLISVANKYPDYGLYSPMHIKGDKKSLYIEIEDWETDHADQLLSDCYFSTLKDIYTYKYINAAAWFIPRRTLEIIGGFDPIFFLYGEDDNYLQRMEYHGLKVGLCPKIQIVHDHQEYSAELTSTYLEFRENQRRLSRYANILQPLDIKKQFYYFLRKMFKALLEGKRSQYKNWRKEYRFFKDYASRLAESRAKNSIKQANWL